MVRGDIEEEIRLESRSDERVCKEIERGVRVRENYLKREKDLRGIWKSQFGVSGFLGRKRR